MILKEFEYTLFIKDLDGIEKENWKLVSFNLSKINLIVGKNAIGKTKTLSYIMFLGQILSGKYPTPNPFNCKAVFLDNNNKKIIYSLKLSHNNLVLEESLVKNGEILIKRDENEKNNVIYSEKYKKHITFKPPKNKLTVEVRRNEEEYPYLEELLYWGNNLYSFSFSGVPLYQLSNIPGYEILFNDINKMIDIVKINPQEDFKEVILADLNYIGYDIEDYFLDYDYSKIILKERGFERFISQFLMSAGMYRAFSILVIFNHYLRLKRSCTLIIDDLGEGLDFDRSSKLTRLLFDKVKDTDIQLIVTSNDRFLMNAVDLEYWNILDRKGHTVTSYNYENSRDTFEGFSFTGLNNFDFFALDFYKGEDND